MTYTEHRVEQATPMNIPSFFSSAQSRWFCLLLLTLSFAAPLGAQQATTLEDIAQLRGMVGTDATLTEETRADLLSQLDTAQGLLASRNKFVSRAAELSELMDTADQRVEQYNLRLATAKEASLNNAELLPEGATSDQIRSQITLTSAERRALGERRTQLLQEADNQSNRRSQIQERLIELQKQQSDPVPQTDAESLSAQVARVLATARDLSRDAEQRALELEILSEPARARVNTAERAWLGFAIDAADVKLAQLNSALESARSSDTQEQLETTAKLQEQLEGSNTLLQQFAAENLALAEQLQNIPHSIDRAAQESQRLGSVLEAIQQDAVLMKRRLEVAGRKEVLGRVMITRLDSLPDTDKLKRALEKRNGSIAEASLTQIDMEEEFRAINEKQEYMAALVPDLQTWQPEAQGLANDLVDQRKELLERNLRSYGSLLHQLLENNENTVKLIAATEAFHKFLMGNLLWVRNFAYSDLGKLRDQLASITSPGDWASVPGQLNSGFSAKPWSSVLVVLILLSLVLRRQLRPVYDRMLSKPMLVSTATLWHMIAGLALSALLVLPWPLLLYSLGVMLREGSPASELTDALAPALEFTSRILYVLLLTRLIASRQGVGRRFLKWNARMLDALRKELNWAGPIICVGALMDVLLFNLDTVVSGGPLGAVATVGGSSQHDRLLYYACCDRPSSAKTL